MSNLHPTLVRYFSQVDYLPCWQAMKTFSDRRDEQQPDELWVLEHPPVFTQGQAGKAEHVLAAGGIPVVQTDRGGQVTYHGPGQTVIYLLFDIRRMGIGARELVTRIENALIETLAGLDINAAAKPDAPGVYVDGAKIASLGLRIRKGHSYHGLAINRDLDLSVFQRINPCGYAGQPVTSLKTLGVNIDRDTLDQQLLTALSRQYQLQLQTAPAPEDWYNPLISDPQHTS